jgi:tetratricopeptide (TPR) repeat protein
VATRFLLGTKQEPAVCIFLTGSRLRLTELLQLFFSGRRCVVPLQPVNPERVRDMALLLCGDANSGIPVWRSAGAQKTKRGPWIGAQVLFQNSNKQAGIGQKSAVEILLEKFLDCRLDDFPQDYSIGEDDWIRFFQGFPTQTVFGMVSALLAVGQNELSMGLIFSIRPTSGFEHLQTFNTKSQTILCRLAEPLIRSKRWGACRNHLRLLSEFFPLNPFWLTRLAEAEAGCGNFDEATALVEDAYSKDPDLKDGFARIARFALDSKNWEMARTFLDRDHFAQRMSSPWVIRLVESEAILGNIPNAYRILMNTPTFCSSYAPEFSWVESINTEQDWSIICFLVILRILRAHQKENEAKSLLVEITPRILHLLFNHSDQGTSTVPYSMLSPGVVSLVVESRLIIDLIDLPPPLGDWARRFIETKGFYDCLRHDHAFRCELDIASLLCSTTHEKLIPSLSPFPEELKVLPASERCSLAERYFTISCKTGQVKQVIEELIRAPLSDCLSSVQLLRWKATFAWTSLVQGDHQQANAILEELPVSALHQTPQALGDVWRTRFGLRQFEESLDLLKGLGGLSLTDSSSMGSPHRTLRESLFVTYLTLRRINDIRNFPEFVSLPSCLRAVSFSSLQAAHFFEKYEESLPVLRELAEDPAISAYRKLQFSILHANAHAHLHQISKAINILKETEVLNPPNPCWQWLHHFHLALFLMGSGRSDEARLLLCKALQVPALPFHREANPCHMLLSLSNALTCHTNHIPNVFTRCAELWPYPQFPIRPWAFLLLIIWGLRFDRNTASSALRQFLNEPLIDPAPLVHFQSEFDSYPDSLLDKESFLIALCYAFKVSLPPPPSGLAILRSLFTP